MGLILFIFFLVWLFWDDFFQEKNPNQSQINHPQYSGQKQAYHQYLLSDAWKRKRYVTLKRDHWQCVYCGSKAVQVHHTRYSRTLGREPIDWLQSVCRPCHERIHRVGFSGKKYKL